MKRRLFFILVVFVAWLPIFAIQKPVFMIYHHALSAGYSLIEWLDVIRYGLRLDCTVAGYLTVIPLLCTILSLWLPTACIKKCLRVYFCVASVVIAAIFAGDVALYTFWGFRLDATVLFYIQFPSGAAGNVPAALFIRQALMLVVYAFASAWMLNRWALPIFPDKPMEGVGVHRFAALLVMGGLLFLPIRSSVTTSTANVGMVYFSNNQFLNHSAINPIFSMVASLYKQQDFASQFQFFDEGERKDIFASLMPELPDSVAGAGKAELLNTKRPNILLIILESFSANTIEALNGEAGVTPNLNSLSREGVLFTNIHANSFRTDRGLVSALNGYPAQPTTSIMKYPAKSQTLPSISKSLISEGYTAEMLYGGDINYTNMQSYFYSSGYSEITSDKDFPLTSRLSKWGADDDVTFDYLYLSLSEKDAASPFLYTFLTLSSHEPFEVPYRRLAHPYLNSVAFTDSCIGNFIGKIKQTPLWENLLVVLVADHGFRYPGWLKEYEPARYRIPVIWTGGAVKEPARIETVGSQSDLAATLLGQMDIPHRDFLFSKDILDRRYPAYAFYTFSNGFGFVDATGVSAYDNDSNRPVYQNPSSGGDERIRKGKALLQTLYDDMGRR